MSARQNKKRKGRNNVNNRERTVTTFTEDPNTSFLVPLSSEEPPGGSTLPSANNLLSSPFSVASSSGQQNSFSQLAHSFSMPFANYIPAQQQQQFFQPFLPPGKNDLEILESLKQMIKEGQHEFYRAVPQPAALASLYMGPIPLAQSQVPPHPEQLPQEYNSPHFSHESVPDARSFNLGGGNSSLDSLAQPMHDMNDVAEMTPADTSANTLGADAIAVDIKPPLGQLDAEEQPQITAQGPPADTKTESTGEYGARPPADTASPSKTAPFEAKDDLARDSTWDRRTLDDRKGRYDDRNDNGNVPHDDRLINGTATATATDSRFPPPEDRRLYDRDRDRDRFLDRERDRDRDWDRDRPDSITRDFRDFRDRDRDRDPRDRRSEFFGRSYGRTHAPRPPPELRHYEPSYGTDYVPPRRHDSDDRRGGLRNGSYDDRSRLPLYDDRRPLYDDRRPPPPAAAADDRRLTMDDRPIRPLPGSGDRALPPSSEDRARPSAEPVSVPRPASDDDRGAQATSLAADERPRTNVSLEERLSQPVTTTPSLQDRLSQPTAVPTRVDVTRPPSLEERLSLGPVAAPAVPTPATATTTTSGRPFVRSASLSRDDLRAPPSKDDAREHDRVSDFRPSPRDFSRERPAGVITASSYRPDPDRSFVGDRDGRDRRDRDLLDVDALPPRFGDSFSRLGGLPPRRFSPPPAFDRDRDRDRDRERERGRAYFPPRSPPPPPSLFRAGDGASTAYDTDAGDRRYATDRDRDMYDQRRREWYGPGPGGDDEKRGGLPSVPVSLSTGAGAAPSSLPPPPASAVGGSRWRPYDRTSFVDRDRFDREGEFRDRDRDRERERERDWDRDRFSTRNHWDDRDRRGFVASPPPIRMDVGANTNVTRSLSSRLTDYPPPPASATDDRDRDRDRDRERDRDRGRASSYVPPPPPPSSSASREFDRARPGYASTTDDHTLPPFSRVRGRSPSPLPGRRPGGDEMRPPMKRAREDGYYAGAPPGSATTTATTTTATTTTASGTGTPPPPSGSNSAFYDREREREREYGGRGEYGMGYERGRRPGSPGPVMLGRMGSVGAGAGAGYVRGGVGRDERRYVPPPPRTG